MVQLPFLERRREGHLGRPGKLPAAGRRSPLLEGIGNNLLFLVFYTVVPLGIGLALAVALHRHWSRTAAVFRVLLFLPQILPMALIGVIWRWMYNPAFGPLNRLLRDAGLAALARPWLGDFGWALPSVGVVASWYYYGFCLAVFLAGLQKIDRSLYDAARIDGAGSGQQLRTITLPELRGEIAVAATFTLIAALRVFDLVFVTTRGGPGSQTLVAALYLYRHAFQQSEVGYGAAVAMVISVLVIGATLLLRRWQERET